MKDTLRQRSDSLGGPRFACWDPRSPGWDFPQEGGGDSFFEQVGLALIDTQNDSIQSLNFVKIGFNSIFDSILVSQNSIQTIIQFKNNCGDSIQ